ncbi:two pore domain potassium channel family protein [Saccharibacillus alkalitolerans]|uniref:Two pore domain potassium channel family protein n=1 Tax=Saccharibacillus alkalitolerans TaxID=2705290 RepID=A0ABX0FAE5_9BACL|nr:two pore domain potassium channel family protein [Saccharibacillus alkalitolerans]NGZ77263.1 two pore domain potassium channel family protein [Saccharibacillus alkalitolerans]
MNEWYGAAGLILIGIALIDFVWSTLWVEGGAGPVTRRLSTGLWKVFHKLFGRRPQALSLAGPVILSLTVLTWVVMLWVGWTLVFASDPSALFNPQTNTEASWAERLYFSGYVLFTLGNGSLVPNGTRWEMATVAATGTGMLSITLAATYLISVLSATAQKRAFAQNVFGMGRSGEEIVLSAWNGKDFHQIDLLLHDCASQLSMLTAQHHAYPILYYYRSKKTEQSAVAAVAVLEDALSLLQFGMRPADLVNTLVLKEMRSSIDSYVSTLHVRRLHEKAEMPEPPSLSALRERGIPVRSEADFEEKQKQAAEHRRKLSNILRASSWRWPRN